MPLHRPFPAVNGLTSRNSQSYVLGQAVASFGRRRAQVAPACGAERLYLV